MLPRSVFLTNGKGKEMPNIKINNVDYDTDTLPEPAKAQLQMLLTVDAEIKRLNAQLAIAKTAQEAYGHALANAVKTPVLQSDTMKL